MKHAGRTIKKKTPKRFSKKDGYAAIDLLQYARDHLASARVLFERSYDCYDSAGHLSHLGIELMLKALLLELKGSFPAEHDLMELLAEIAEHQPSFSLQHTHRQTILRINQFMALRYPTPNEGVEIGTEDWGAIEELFKALLLELPDGLKEAFLQLSRTRKGGRILMQKPIDGKNA